MMYHQRDPTTTVPLFLQKNSLRIRGNPIVHHMSLVMEEDMPVRLSAQSPLRLLDRRLDERASPKHGTKLDKWTRLEKRENELMRERKSLPAIEAEREADPEGRRRKAAIPISDPREPTNTEIEVHELTHLPPKPWCEQCVRGRGTENPHKRVTFERAESTFPVIAFDFCFIKASGIIPGVTADEGATCLVLLDVDTGVHEGCTSRWKDRHRLPELRAANASSSNSSDVEFVYVVMGNPRALNEPIRARLEGDTPDSVVLEVLDFEHQDMTVKQILQNEPFGRSKNKSSLWPWLIRHAGW